MFFFKTESSVLQSSSQERAEAIEKLITLSTVRKGYYLMLPLSVLITTAGLLANSSAVIIGGMILAPLLLPMLLLALSLVTGSWRGIRHSLGTLVASLIIIFGISFLMTWVMSQGALEVSWIPTSINPDLYIVIAFCSGVAGAIAWVKEELSPTIAGTAVAVSLLPPLCAVGIATAYRNNQLALDSLTLFALNIVGIIFGAVIVFAILGFLNSGKVQEKALEKEEKNSKK